MTFHAPCTCSENDRHFFPSETWNVLPQLLADLLERGRVILCTIEDTDTGDLCFLGGAGFVDPAFLDRAAFDGTDNLIGLTFTEESQGRSVFLNVKQVADANRRADLRLLNFFGEPSKLNIALDAWFTLNSWNFFHQGFHFERYGRSLRTRVARR